MRSPGSPRHPNLLRNGGFVLCGLVLGVLLATMLAASHTRGTVTPAAPVRLVAGVPVGVLHTPAGALAAADNYLALASQSVEQDPRTFAALVRHDYAPRVRARVLSEAQRIRAHDPQNMSNYEQGGHGIAVIAARRLDTYTSQTATVTSWLGGFVWGPRLQPRQTWNLVDTTLRWQQDRWLIETSSTDTTPAPAPAIVYVNAGNNQTAAFARLKGMTSPFYGTAE